MTEFETELRGHMVLVRYHYARDWQGGPDPHMWAPCAEFGLEDVLMVSPRGRERSVLHRLTAEDQVEIERKCMDEEAWNDMEAQEARYERA